MQSVTITTQPTLEPVTVTECKQYMRVDSTDDDDLITDMIIAARELCEQHTRRKFITTGITLALDAFPVTRRESWWDGVRDGAITELNGYAKKIQLPFPPAISVASITTYDESNASAVYSASNYRLDTDGNILLNDGAIWPINLRDADAVRIVYTCGYGASPTAVPYAIKQAIKMTVAALYDDRSCFALPDGAQQALAPYRVMNERRNGM